VWLGLLLSLAIIQPSKSYLYNNNDEASLLDRLMSSDYLGQEDQILQPGRPSLSELSDYPLYQDLAPRPRYLPQSEVDYPAPVSHHHPGPHTQHRPDHQATHDAPRPPPHHGQPPPQPPRNLNFPALSAKLKQFAVNPGYPEYHADHPDFLKFRLQELEEAETGAKHEDKPSQIQDQELEEQLQAMTGGHLDQLDSKRAMMGGARAEPLISSGEYNTEEQADDLMFTTIVAVCTAASVFAVIGAGFCYHRSSGRSKEQDEVEYPAYGVTGPAKEVSPAGDRKLA